MFPVIMYDGKTPLPEDAIYYIIAKGGIYLYKDLKTIRSLTRVEAISFLKDVEGFAELKIPLIPKKIIAQAVGYLRYVYQKCHSEGGLILHLYPETGEYKLYCPTQEVSSCNVEWDNEKETIPQGAIRICSIHSHGFGSAFHSGIDKEYEKSFDGIHITIGHINDEVHSMVASIVVNGNRFKLDEKQIPEYIETNIIPIEGSDKIQSVQPKNECGAPVYEDYQAILGDHNLCDITVNPKLKKWEGYVIEKNGYTSDERRFILDVELSDYTFPCEWKGKFNHKIPKVYCWDSKSGKLVETYNYNQHHREHNWSKWSEKDNTPNYPLMHNSHYPKNDDVECILPINRSGLDLGNCFGCMYKLFIEDMVNQGVVELSEVEEYMGICNSDKIPYDYLGINDSNDYYEYPENQENMDQYDLHYDGRGNMVDSDGNIITVMTKEEQDYIDKMMSSKDHK